jgi:hypothetical protein
MTHIKCLLQLREMTFECSHNLSSSCFPTRNFDTVGSPRSYVDHFFEFRMFECMNRLKRWNVNSGEVCRKADVLYQLTQAIESWLS